ncbi:MAG: ribonuclease HI [Candidatus Synechococcus spongiarum SP3]|uniref:Ribonuclease H n=1 Tax=Candidatus Synechococcus spongiarum SP3 TaxID=1604020 RepID=A0A0G2IW55_9SYNE|nr:MAG: ribonuclease HI [Candidatus Synechococcus spongiarum SP3]
MVRPHLITAACDGACSGNPGPGGWSYLLRFDDGRVEERGGFSENTTNNRMEMQAALALLKRIAREPRQTGFTIRTDSKYLVYGFSQWLKGWKQRGWKKSDGQPVLNRDLWEALDQARLPGVELTHVKGHSGDPDNERVDAIAVAFRDGKQPVLRSGSHPSTSHQPDAGDPVDPAPAPPPLQRLLTRLETADRLAAGGYELTVTELAQLVEMPSMELSKRRQLWTWRDWQVLPCPDGRWRLQRKVRDA